MMLVRRDVTVIFIPAPTETETACMKTVNDEAVH